MATPYKRIQVIINPAAGQDEPILNTLNDVFQSYEIDWDVAITQRLGDGKRAAQAAVEAGVDVVAVYGGDGTVMDVASGLIGSEMPLAILPGGTGNALLVELGIPLKLAEAAALLCAEPSRVRAIDAAQIGEHYSLLRVDAGIGAKVSKAADREMKDRLGMFAYIVAGIRELTTSPRVNFQLKIDGEEIERQGIACMITNVGSLGRLNLSLSSSIKPDDGVMNVFVINNDLASALALAASVTEVQQWQDALEQWPCHEITVNADPPQPVEIDGDPLDLLTPFTLKVLPGAIHVLVPDIE